MGRRLDLHHLLEATYEEATGLSSEKRVWFQPPSSVKLVYPCLIYKLTDMPPTYANNNPYQIEHEYELSVIDHDVNSALREMIAGLQKCRFTRSFEKDNLHHYVFHIYD